MNQTNALPHYLTRQALSSYKALRVETPTLIRQSIFHPHEGSEIIEWEVDFANLAEFLSYETAEGYFHNSLIHRKGAANREHYYLQPLLSTVPTVNKPYHNSGLDEVEITANREFKEREIRKYHADVIYRKVHKEAIKDTRRYHLRNLNDKLLVSCPATGIMFECSMPALPIHLEVKHPLSSVENIFATVEWFTVTSETKDRMSELDTPLLCGMLLVLLRAKHLLVEAETSSLAENAALQVIPKETLARYILTIVRGWEKQRVWSNVSHVRLCAEGEDPAATLNAWFLSLVLHLAGKSFNEKGMAAKLFEATRPKTAAERTIKVYSAETTQHKHIEETKVEAYALYKALSPLMTPVLKTLVRSTLIDLLVITPEAKQTVSEALSKQFLGTPHQSSAQTLIGLIEGTETGHIAKELGRVSDSFNIPHRSIQQILAAKADKQNTVNTKE